MLIGFYVIYSMGDRSTFYKHGHKLCLQNKFAKNPTGDNFENIFEHVVNAIDRQEDKRDKENPLNMDVCSRFCSANPGLNENGHIGFANPFSVYIFHRKTFLFQFWTGLYKNKNKFFKFTYLYKRGSFG